MVLEALKGEKTIVEITAKYGIHATQITNWKKLALAVLAEAFSSNRKHQADDHQALIDELYKQTGQLNVANEFLKKSLNVPLEIRKMWLDSGHYDLSLRRQCRVLGISRSNLTYRPAEIAAYTLMLMHELDRQDTETPFYGVLKMTEHLRLLGHPVNPKRARRLLRRMGLEAVYPKPKLSRLNPQHQVYPYLLKNLPIERCKQVWYTNIPFSAPSFEGIIDDTVLSKLKHVWNASKWYRDESNQIPTFCDK